MNSNVQLICTQSKIEVKFYPKGKSKLQNDINSTTAGEISEKVTADFCGFGNFV